MARMTAPDGTVVTVDDAKVAALTHRGYSVAATDEKAKAKKSSGSSKSDDK